MLTNTTCSQWHESLIRAFVLMILALVWEYAVFSGMISRVLFPAPHRIIARLGALSMDQFFRDSVGASMGRFMWGIIWGVPCAVICGYAIGLSRWAARIFEPLISITYPLPKAAVFPLLMLMFGMGDTPKIILIAAGIFYYVCLSVTHAIRELPQQYFDIVSVYRISRVKTFIYVIGKGILPEILHGCKVGISYGLVMVVVGEFVMAKNGLGYFMWNAWDAFRVEDVYAILVVFGILGWCIFALFDLAIRALPWKRTE